MKTKIEWILNQNAGNFLFNNEKGKVYLSYQPNNCSFSSFSFFQDLDSANPETAIILINDKIVDGKKRNRYLIFRGDRRKELEKIYPNIKKLKEYWKKYGGHFWSDSLEN